EIAGRLRAGVVDPDGISEDLIEEDTLINNSVGAAEAFQQLANYYRDQIDDDAAAPLLAAAQPAFPVGLVWGAQDASVAPEYGMAARDLIPGATFELIEGCGHLPYWERPDESNALLIAFARRCLGS